MNPEDLKYWRERIFRVNRNLHDKLGKLAPALQQIAINGIARHLIACDKTKCPPSLEAMSEIIKDAKLGRKVYADTGHDKVFVGNQDKLFL